MAGLSKLEQIRQDVAEIKSAVAEINSALIGDLEKGGLVDRVVSLEDKEKSRAKREYALWSALVGAIGSIVKMATTTKIGGS